MRVPFCVVRTRSATETRTLAEGLGHLVRSGGVFLLCGDLGTGKTTFVQGFATALGIASGVRSPTYTIAHSYDDGDVPLLHLDLYRCESPHDVLDLGLTEQLEGDGVTVVEWGERAFPIVGEDYLELAFAWDPDDDDTRTIQFFPSGSWRDRMSEIADVVRVWAGGVG